MSDRKILDLPTHKNPVYPEGHPQVGKLKPERTASAPYNFVPLPEVVVTAVDDAKQLPHHDTYANTGYPHTGYFEVTLTTKSPLYVRCGLSTTRPNADTASEWERSEAEKLGRVPSNFREAMKNKSDFFYTSNRNQPVIPGSSLRGMLRSLLEIVSYGKVERVTDKNLFFRTVDNSAVGLHYRDRMVGSDDEHGNKVEAGFMTRSGGDYMIRVCPMARVDRKALSGNIYDGSAPNKTPRWNGAHHQYSIVWVQLSTNEKFVQRIENAPQTGLSEGRLVITGDIPRKKREFVFLMPPEDAEQIPVPGEIVERFHDDDQLTQWQERAFPKDQPNNKCRERDGALRKNPQDGEPVFFLRENGQLSFFGRAQMFRLPTTKHHATLCDQNSAPRRTSTTPTRCSAM